MTPRLRPGELAARLADLPVRVEAAEVVVSEVPLPDYPGEPRPSGVVVLTGGGHQGRGENVAFSAGEQAAFRETVAAWTCDDPTTVGAALSLECTRYERAALEAALIDLALRQAGLTLFELTGVKESALRFVVSLAASPDPVEAIARARATGYGGELKIDVDPSWNRDTLAALGRDPGVVILDFKLRGDAALARMATELVPGALLEDPPARDGSSWRTSRDASLATAADVLAAVDGGDWVNLKAPRMGGPLEVLRSLEHAFSESASARAYVGGMFEVGVGREQARQIAALYCPQSPNDLASNVSGVSRTIEGSPAHVRFDRAGFG